MIATTLFPHSHIHSQADAAVDADDDEADADAAADVDEALTMVSKQAWLIYYIVEAFLFSSALILIKSVKKTGCM